MPDGTTYSSTINEGTPEEQTFQHGRLMQHWDAYTSGSQVNNLEKFGPSYRSYLTVPPFTESWSTVDLDYAWATDDNPHLHGDYTLDGSYGSAAGHASFAVNQGESFSWSYTGVNDAVEDQIVVTKWMPGYSTGGDGVIFTVRLLFDEPLVEEDLWWDYAGYGMITVPVLDEFGEPVLDEFGDPVFEVVPGGTYSVMGNFDVFPTYGPGDVNEDGYVDDHDIDLMGDYISTGVPPTTANYDLNGDLTVDVLDLDIRRRSRWHLFRHLWSALCRDRCECRGRVSDQHLYGK